MEKVGTIVAVLKNKGVDNANVDVKFTNLNLVEATTIVAMVIIELSKQSNIPPNKVVELILEGIKKGE